MQDGRYRRRLQADLPQWQQNGWITPAGAEAILASLPAARPGIGFAGLVAGMGALLVGLGLMGLVAANWEEIPRLVRLFGLVGLLGLAFAAAWRLRLAGRPRGAEAAELLAGLVYAAAIALVAQTFHIEGDASGGVFLWAVGCLIAGALIRSHAFTLLAIVGAGYWPFLVVSEMQATVHGPGLAFILAGLALAVAIGAGRARQVGVLAIMAWSGIALVATGERLDWSFGAMAALAALLALAGFFAGTALRTLRAERIALLGRDLRWPALLVAVLAVAALQESYAGRPAVPGSPWLPIAGLAALAMLGFAAACLQRGALSLPQAGLGPVLIAGILAAALAFFDSEMVFRCFTGGLTLMLSLWLVSLGQSGAGRAAGRLGMVLFGVEVLYLYVQTIGTVLDTGLAMLTGGMLFIALSFGLLRLGRLQTNAGASA